MTTSYEFSSNPTYPHDCPYVDRMAHYLQYLEQHPTSDNTSRSQEYFIEKYHRGNTCPPTHDERNLPTTEWADFVELSRY